MGTNRGVIVKTACVNLYQDNYLEPELYVVDFFSAVLSGSFLVRTFR